MRKTALTAILGLCMTSSLLAQESFREEARTIFKQLQPLKEHQLGSISGRTLSIYPGDEEYSYTIAIGEDTTVSIREKNIQTKEERSINIPFNGKITYSSELLPIEFRDIYHTKNYDSAKCDALIEQSAATWALDKNQKEKRIHITKLRPVTRFLKENHQKFFNEYIDRTNKETSRAYGENSFSTDQKNNANDLIIKSKAALNNYQQTYGKREK